MRTRVDSHPDDSSSVTVRIDGEVAAGFAPVRRAFAENFARRGELGAACAVYHRGEKVVDLWGGVRDHRDGAPFLRDTMLLVFSTTKGISAMTMAVAHARGLFEYDRPVAAYWPEFGQRGKEQITVRQLLSHQAGLPVIDTPLTADTLADPDRVARVLARQKPLWKPGAYHGYHAFSLGWYESALLRRVDPERRTLGQYFRDEVAAPLGLDFYIGLPETVDKRRVARLKPFRPVQMLRHLDTMPPRMVLAFMLPWSITARTFNNPRVGDPAGLGGEAFQRVEIPAGNGIGEVRAIARLYSAFATGGDELGIDADTLAALTRPAQPPTRSRFDRVLKVDTVYGLGVTKPFRLSRFGSSDAAFGTPGAGGSFGFADPDAHIGFAYAPTRMGFHIWDDPREKALRDAVYDCVR